MADLGLAAVGLTVVALAAVGLAGDDVAGLGSELLQAAQTSATSAANARRRVDPLALLVVIIADEPIQPGTASTNLSAQRRMVDADQ